MNLKQVEVISIRKLEGAGNLRAFIDIRVGGALVITQCAVMNGKRGLFVCMPRQVGRDGKWKDFIHVVDDDLKELYQKTIMRAYMEEVGDNEAAKPADDELDLGPAIEQAIKKMKGQQ